MKKAYRNLARKEHPDKAKSLECLEPTKSGRVPALPGAGVWAFLSFLSQQTPSPPLSVRSG